MSEPSNGSLQGMIASLGASAKPGGAKNGLKSEAGAEDGKAFAKTLDQELGRQAEMDVAASVNPAAKAGDKSVVASSPLPVQPTEPVGSDSQAVLAAQLTDSDEQLRPAGGAQEVAEQTESGDAVAASSTVSAADARQMPRQIPEDVSLADTELLSEEHVQGRSPALRAQHGNERVESGAMADVVVTPTDAEQSQDTRLAAADVPVPANPELPLQGEASTKTTQDSPNTAPAIATTTASATTSDTVVGTAPSSVRPGDGLAAATLPLTDATTIESQSATAGRSAEVIDDEAVSPAATIARSNSVERSKQQLPTLSSETADSAAATTVAPQAGLGAVSASIGGAAAVAEMAPESVPGAAPAGAATPARTVEAGGVISRAAAERAATPAPAVAEDDVISPVAAKRSATSAPAPAVEVGEVISQAALAVRYRHAGNDVDGQVKQPVFSDSDSALPVIAGDAKTGQVNQAGVVEGQAGNLLTPSMLAAKTDGSALPANEPEMAMDHAELLKGLQTQRAALTDSLPLQGTTSPADALVKPASTDNMFLPVTGGIVTAPVLQRAEATPQMAASAPFELPLLAEDAEVAMASNVKWMAKDGVQNATVTVSPAGMGPISVKVGIEQDHMSVSIVASQHATREALDSMLPRLRDQLASQGHENVKLDVSDGRAEQDKGGNGQMFAGMRNPSGTWTQGEQRNSASNGNQSDFGHSNGSSDETDGHMAEDLQRVPRRAAGGSQTPSVFDAYV